jgi:hypothetical protein
MQPTRDTTVGNHWLRQLLYYDTLQRKKHRIKQQYNFFNSITDHYLIAIQGSIL